MRGLSLVVWLCILVITVVEHVPRPVIAGNIGTGYGASVARPVGE